MKPFLKKQQSLASLFFLFLLSACARQPLVLESQIAEALPDVVNLKTVPFFPQTKYQCGPATLAGVIDFYYPDADITPEQLAPQVWTPKVKGAWPVEMRSTLRRNNLIPYHHAITPEQLLQEVAAGNPVLVMLDLGIGPLKKWHYAIVVGFDLENDLILMRSETTEERWMHWHHFRKGWKKSGYWNSVPLPPHSLPAAALGGTIWLDISDMEQIDPDAVKTLWELAAVRWPDTWQLWFGAGNSAYFDGRPGDATSFFLSGLEANNTQASIWNNLGYALNSQGCGNQAIQSVNCAILLDPENAEWQSSALELMGRPAQSSTQCPELPICPIGE